MVDRREPRNEAFGFSARQAAGSHDAIDDANRRLEERQGERSRLIVSDVGDALSSGRRGADGSGRCYARALQRGQERREGTMRTQRGGEQGICGVGFREHALRELERVEAPPADINGDAVDARQEPGGIDRRRIEVRRVASRRRRPRARVVRKHAFPEAALSGADERAIRLDSDDAERHRRIEWPSAERLFLRLPLVAGALEDVEQRAYTLNARRPRQRRTRRESQPRLVEVRERVVEPGEVAGLVAEEAPHECRRPGGLGPDDRLPQRFGLGSTGHGHSPGPHAHARPEHRERPGMTKQVAQRLAFRPEPRQRFVVETREPMIEERRAAIRQHGGDDLVVGDLALEQRLTPDGRVERQRHVLARDRRRAEERRAKVLALPRVARFEPHGEERPHDIEDEAAAIERRDVERARDLFGGRRQRHGHAHRGLPGADSPVGEQEDDDDERPRTHGSTTPARGRTCQC